MVDGQTTSAGPSTFVGVETLLVGGTEVEALHLHGTRTLSGAQEGDERTDLWFRRGMAAPALRARTSKFAVPLPVGVITYHAVEFELTDLRPGRRRERGHPRRRPTSTPA